MSGPTGPLRPQRAIASFECLGSECEDTCCSGMRVEVTEDELPGLLARWGPAWSERLLPTAANGGRALEQGRDGCVALRKGLCGLQLDLGEGALSRVCRSFPRQERNVGGSAELTLSLACPEAVRILLDGSEERLLFEAEPSTEGARRSQGDRVDAASNALPDADRQVYGALADVVRARLWDLLDEGPLSIGVLALGRWTEATAAFFHREAGPESAVALQATLHRPSQELPEPAAVEEVPALVTLAMAAQVLETRLRREPPGRVADTLRAGLGALGLADGASPTEHLARVATAWPANVRGLGARDGVAEESERHLVRYLRAQAIRRPHTMYPDPSSWALSLTLRLVLVRVCMVGLQIREVDPRAPREAAVDAIQVAARYLEPSGELEALELHLLGLPLPARAARQRAMARALSGGV